MSASKAAAIVRIMGGPHPDPRFVSWVTARITRGRRPLTLPVSAGLAAGVTVDG